MDLMKEHYRLLQLPQGWTPKIADWPKIVEAAKGGKSDPPAQTSRDRPCDAVTVRQGQW